MQKNYYQNILYPLQDKILRIMEKLPVDFYLTGGTALGRVYLNHRYSDDLDFFVNQNTGFKNQVGLIIESFKNYDLNLEIAVTGENFTRLFISEKEALLKLDFVNDIIYRVGEPVQTIFFSRTDTVRNILSNKVAALSRHSEKDVADLVFIALKYDFSWMEILKEASEKDLWINPVEASKILDEFPVEKLKDINWIHSEPDFEIFKEQLRTLISDLLLGRPNSLYKTSTSV